VGAECSPAPQVRAIRGWGSGEEGEDGSESLPDSIQAMPTPEGRPRGPCYKVEMGQSAVLAGIHLSTLHRLLPQSEESPKLDGASSRLCATKWVPGKQRLFAYLA
jgi:hypothetical protein